MKGDKSIVSLRGEMSHLGLCCSDIGENWISILLIYGSNSHGILTDIYMCTRVRYSWATSFDKEY